MMDSYYKEMMEIEDIPKDDFEIFLKNIKESGADYIAYLIEKAWEDAEFD